MGVVQSEAATNDESEWLKIYTNMKQEKVKLHFAVVVVDYFYYLPGTRYFLILPGHEPFYFDLCFNSLLIFTYGKSISIVYKN